MANVLTGKYLYFDTTSSASVTGQLRIIAVFWTGIDGNEIVADNDLAITDANSNSIIKKRAKFAGDDLGIVLSIPLIVNGITVSALDAGVVHVWVA